MNFLVFVEPVPSNFSMIPVTILLGVGVGIAVCVGIAVGTRGTLVEGIIPRVGLGGTKVDVGIGVLVGVAVGSANLVASTAASMVADRFAIGVCKVSCVASTAASTVNCRLGVGNGVTGDAGVDKAVARADWIVAPTSMVGARVAAV